MGTHTAGAAAPGEGESQGHITGYGSVPYRSYVLNSMLLVYILNFIDRGLLSVVARPLKAEIQMSDTAWGLLTGFGFALLYTLVGIPLAQVSETRNRVWIMAICLALWSLMTALCGLSTDITIGGIVIGGFWMLLTFRIGVGIGEAGCTPPANSLIADYFPQKKRSTALGYYAMGVTLGTMLANMIGGPVTDMFGWRNAFFILGLPGVAVAIIMVLTVKDPPRGYTDPPGTVRKAKAPFFKSLGAVLQVLASRPSFWWMTAGATLAAFCGYAIASFQSLYIQRTFDVTAGEAALWVNAPAYAAGAVGTVLMGWMAERIGARSPTAIAWLAAGGLLLSVPFYFMAFNSASLMFCIIGLAAGHFVKYGYLAAQYTIGQGVVSAQMRATSTAFLLFVINLLGYGLGPLFAGFLSDLLFKGIAADAGHQGLGTSVCDSAAEALKSASTAAGGPLEPGVIADLLAGLERPLTQAEFDFCFIANASATEGSMLTISALYAVAGLCFFVCMFYLKKDFAKVRGPA